MNGKSGGPALQRRGCVTGAERRVRNEDPIITQARPAAVRAIVDRDRTDSGRNSQIYLPPGIGFQIGRGDRPVIEIPVGYTIYRRAGAIRLESPISAALRGRLP